MILGGVDVVNAYDAPVSRRFLVAAVLIVTSGLLGGCRERDDLAGDTVRVTLPERTTQLEVISCGLDDDVFVLGASSADVFVQILLTIVGEEDDVEVDTESSAVSVDIAREAVLGAGSSSLLQVQPGVPGEISSASIRGDRVELTAEARSIGDARSAGSTPVTVEARCPAVADFT